MASSVLLKRTSFLKSTVNAFQASRAYASVAVGSDLISAAPDVSLQKARSWDESVSSKFATTSLKDIFKVTVFYRIISECSCFRVFFFGDINFVLLVLISQEKKVVIFGLPGAYTGVCSSQHVPSYKNNIDKFKAKGVDSVICVSVNDPYVINGWAEKLQAQEAVSFSY
ncbi:hypothetical protein ACS0TY_022665 [Phlomoides rotata]